VSSPVVRTAANGDLLVLWSDGSRVRASFRLNGGRFFSPHVVPGLHSLDTRLAPAAGGLATWSSPPVQPYAHP
jgi:hypothetical protein